jgi:xylulokinase
MAFDVTKKCWDKSLLSLAGIDESKMSTPVPSGTVVGTIHDELSVQLGLPSDLKVVTGGHDQVCAAVGAGVATVGTAIDGIGTVECITPVFSSPILESGFLNNNFACVPYAIPGTYATYAFNFTGGSLLKWFRDNLAAKEEIEARETGKSVYRILDEKCAKQPTSVMVIPHFAGSGTPDMNSSDTGSIVGITFNHGSPEIYRALLEGVTFEMKYNMELLKSVGVEITELRAVGGGAKSKLWLEIKAAITGCRILQLEVDEAGITGAAILASVAMGNYSSINEAAEVFIKVKNIIEPDLELKAKYDEMYLQYKKIRNRCN